MSYKDVGTLFFQKKLIFWNATFNNLEKHPNEVKQRLHKEETDHSDYFMTCTNTIPSTSNTLKKLLLNFKNHSSYIQR